MRVISSLLLILALHFLLQGINFKKKKEEFHIIECKTKKDNSVKPLNNFADDKNDANFESDVLDVNNFYKQNDKEELDINKPKKDDSVKVSINSNKPVKSVDSWKYKNEFVMNGGELLNGITGFNLNDNTSDNLSSQYFIHSKDGGLVDDDIRMGLGSMNMDKRLKT